MKLQLKLIEQLTDAEAAQAVADTGHTLAALQDVFIYHAGVRWRILEQLWPSHVRRGHVVVPLDSGRRVAKRIEVVFAEPAAATSAAAGADEGEP